MQFRLELGHDVVEAFAAATGDRSSIHTDVEFARRTRFRRPIVHGLLPVSWLLLRAIPESEQRTHYLQQISCRFLRPAHVGDTLDLILKDRELEERAFSYRFDILHAADGSTVTAGSGKLARGTELLRTSSTGDVLPLFSQPLIENSFNVDDLKPGYTEALAFNLSPITAGTLRGIMGEQQGSARNSSLHLFDLNLVATLPVSALIGMRLPGRLATLTGLEVKFESAISANTEMTLRGKLEKVMTASGRAQISLEWIQDGQIIGRGLASTLVGRSSPIGITCKSLKGIQFATGITGKVALVTGASRGIGEATAKLLAMQGSKVAVHYFRGEKDAAAIVKDIRDNGGTAFAVYADLREEALVRCMFGTIRETIGEVDILVNNAVGDYSPKPLESVAIRDYIDELSVSLFGLHTCCKLALPSMRSRRRGKIINLGSIVTEVPVIGQNKYIAAKSAVVGYTRSLAVELAHDNVQVNVVVPSMTETTLIDSVGHGFIAKHSDESPSGHLLQPVEVAKAIAFLASDWADCISGQKLVLNQGAAPFL